MKRLLKVLGVLLVFSSLGMGLVSCMPPTAAVSREKSVKREVIHVLLTMQTAYEKRNIDEFMVWVSNKYRKRAAFRKEILKDFDASRDIRLRIVIDRILVGDKGADLRVHWFRTWVPFPGGKVKKTEGQARFMFTLNPIRLLFQVGEKPFGLPGTGL